MSGYLPQWRLTQFNIVNGEKQLGEWIPSSMEVNAV